MKYIIPIEPEVTKENADILWRHYNAESLDASFKWMIIGVGITVLGFSLTLNKYVLVMLAGLGLAMAGIFGYFFYLLKKLKKKYMAESQKFYSEPGEMTVEFTDEHFNYKDHLIESSISWKVLRSYFITEGVLYVMLNNDTGYMISRKVVSESDLKEMETFLKGKLTREQKKLAL